MSPRASLLAAVDAAVVLLALLLAVALRDALPTVADHSADPVVVPLLGLWLLALAAFGTYAERHRGAGSSEFGRVFLASTTTAGMVAIAAFLARYPLSRGFFVIAFTLGTPLLLLERQLVRRAVHQLHRRGRLTHRLLLVGSAAHVDHIAQVLHREAWLGFRVVGALTPPGPTAALTAALTAAVDRLRPSAVIFVGGYTTTPAEVRHRIWELDERGIATFIVPGLTEVAGDRLRMHPVGGLPLVHVAAPGAGRAARAPKRLFDVAVAALLLLATAPLLAVVAVAIRLADGGPVLYHQTRVGRDGQLFRICKFRTMVPHADRLDPQLRACHQAPGEVLFKLADDPRVTGPGRFLRRFSLDELPQLWNVLAGHMSLVGPRPALPQEVALLTEQERLRHRVRPGLTGLWQVSGRANLSREDAARLDLYYVENWSPAQDLLILTRTVGAVLRADGAY